jgi:hypothetical protein
MNLMIAPINILIKRFKVKLVNQSMNEINIEDALASVKNKIDQAIARRSMVNALNTKILFCF